MTGDWEALLHMGLEIYVAKLRLIVQNYAPVPTWVLESAGIGG